MMFHKTETRVPDPADPDVDLIVVKTVNSNDGAVSDLLNAYAAKRWLILSINPIISGIGGGNMTSIQVIFSKPEPVENFREMIG